MGGALLFMKIIHTSDWHIGRQFHNVSLLDDQRHVLMQLLDYVEQEAVDAVVIAGDVYDRSVPPASAVELLDEVLHRLCVELKVPVVLIPGNHDSAERLRFGARQLCQAGLHIMGDLTRVAEPVRFEKDDVRLDIYGIPYADPALVRNLTGEAVSTHDDAHTLLAEQIKSAMQQDAINMLVSHCFIDGAEESESERPLSIGGADRVSYQPLTTFDYVALGHLHSPQYRGEEYIRYSGSILKYSFSEQHQNKGITLLEFNAQGLKSHQHLPLVPPRDMRVLEGELQILLEQGKTDPGNEDYLLVRLTDQHAILDPMGKLRGVYPNVLHLEKPGMMTTGEQQTKRERIKRDELELFKDFFTEVRGETVLTEEQIGALQSVISSVRDTANKE